MSFEVCKSKLMQNKPVVEEIRVDMVGIMDLNFDGKAEEPYQIVTNSKTFCGVVSDDLLIQEVVKAMGPYKNLVQETGKPTRVIGSYWRASIQRDDQTTTIAIQKPIPQIDPEMAKAFKVPLFGENGKIGLGDFVLTKANEVFVVIDFNIINAMRLEDEGVSMSAADMQVTAISEEGFKKLKENKKPSPQDIRILAITELRLDPLGPMRKK